ncbi:hypothetical protein HAX54_040161 [Datura stramonium]|uniref:Uncharacterized protein n=1 Tax=Datura stramonium TaxID=4076 RepID=A0ABS8VRV8_DATST|nr:hypothetical protein [Datura stramonium]
MAVGAVGVEGISGRERKYERWRGCAGVNGEFRRRGEREEQTAGLVVFRLTVDRVHREEWYDARRTKRRKIEGGRSGVCGFAGVCRRGQGRVEKGAAEVWPEMERKRMGGARWIFGIL